MKHIEEKSTLETIADDPRVSRLGKALGEDSSPHIVGGALRDVLLGRPAGDIDIATRLLPDEIISRLSLAGIRTFPTGLKHQTVTALPIEGEEAIEITTFRGPDMNPAGGLVAGTSIEEDLQYRDFTINALAYDLTHRRLVDVGSGLSDLNDRLLRTPGDANKRFQEDPLRILRLIRFASELDFQIDPSTSDAAKRHKDLLAQVSIERIRDEFLKILLSPAPSRGFFLLRDFGLLPMVCPELQAMVGVEQNEFHYKDVFEHTLEVVEKTSHNPVLRLAALFHDVGKPATLTVDEEDGFRHFYHHESVGTEMTRAVLSRMRFPNKVTEEVATLVATHMRPLEVGPGGMRRLLRDTGELFDLWRELKFADSSSVKIPAEELQARFIEFDDLLTEVLKGPPVSPLKSLAINGRDLLELGFPESPRIGEVLRALHEQVLDAPEINTREELLKRAREFFPTRA